MKRVCLFTGAGGRLGSWFCERYRDRYDLAAVYRRRPPDAPSQEQRFIDPLAPRAPLADNRDPVFAVQADLAEDGAAERVVARTLARFGRIDLIVNAAADVAFLGAIPDGGGGAEAMKQQLHLNALVPLLVASAAARAFFRDRFDENLAANRNIVNVSSISGLRVFAGVGQSIYGASKAALNHATIHLAHELRALGVRANVVAPTRFPDVVSTEQVAAMIVRLDEGEMTGAIAVMEAGGDRFLRR